MQNEEWPTAPCAAGTHWFFIPHFKFFILHSAFFILIMLCLCFQLGDDRYALDAAQVVEVLPLLELRKIPGAPPGVAGLFNYRGRPVPAVDLGELLLGIPAPERLSTRLILVNHATESGGTRLLGLIAGQVTRIVRKSAAEFQQPVLLGAAPPFLGPVLMDESGGVQLLRPERLLTNDVRELIFAGALEATT